MAAAFGPSLVLEKDRARTHAFVGLNGVHGVLDVAVAVVDIDQNRHIAGRDDVAHRCRDVGEALEADVGHAISRTGDWEAADEHGVESGPLDQQRAQRIVGAGNDEQSPRPDGSVERLTKTSSTAHGGLLIAGSAGRAIGCRLGMIGRHGAPAQLMITTAGSVTDRLVQPGVSQIGRALGGVPTPRLTRRVGNRYTRSLCRDRAAWGMVCRRNRVQSASLPIGSGRQSDRDHEALRVPELRSAALFREYEVRKLWPAAG